MTRIYVSTKKINDNQRKGTRMPPIEVESAPGEQILMASEVEIDGPSRIVYRPDVEKGPRVWLETDSTVRVDPKRDDDDTE